MELRQLEYFIAVARFRNFHRAAAELGVSQPTLSIQIKKLEKDLGIVLLDRDQRGVRLSELGRAFLDRVAPVVTGIRAVAASVSELSALTGRVVIASGVLGTLRIPPVVNAFRARHPKVDLVLRQQPFLETMSLLTSGQADVGIVLVHTAESPVPAGLVVEPRSTAAVGALMRPNHHLAAKTALSLEDLRVDRLVLLAPNSASRLSFDLAAAKAGFRPDIPPFETMSADTLCTLVDEGMGVGISTETTAKGSPHKLVFRKLRDVDPCSLSLVWARDRPRTAAVDAFRDFLRSWPWDRPARRPMGSAA